MTRGEVEEEEGEEGEGHEEGSDSEEKEQPHVKIFDDEEDAPPKDTTQGGG